MRYWFFFFKQKTAYEMRMSDWSSDVCSSDLLGGIIGDLGGIERSGIDVHARTRLDDIGDHQPEDQRERREEQEIGEGLGRDPPDRPDLAHSRKIGRASCRERVCQYV